MNSYSPHNGSNGGSTPGESQGPGSTAGNSATTDARGGQDQTSAVQNACLYCRGKHLRCDGQIPCNRCTANAEDCVYIPSRRGYKGPRKNPPANSNNIHPNKRPASSSPPLSNNGNGDSCPMMLGHGPVHHPLDTMPFNPSIVIPGTQTSTLTASSPISATPLYRNPFNTHTATMDNTLAIIPSNGSSSSAGANGLGLASTAQQPPHLQRPFMSLADRCFDAFYHFFHGAHPFVLPKEFLLRKMKEGSSNLEPLLAAIRYIGSLYLDAGPARATYLDQAIQLCYPPMSTRDGFVVQALLLLIIGLDGSCKQDRARQLLADCETLAVEIDLNTRQFASLNSHNDPVMEESWRRTWWELYVCDGMIAGVHRITNFLLFDVRADVGLPCEEAQYISGHIPEQVLYMEDFDDDVFGDDDREFSSFAYRVAAARNLGRFMRMPPMLFPNDENIARIDAYLTNWMMHLPQSKKESLNKDCQPDEMMFQARFIVYACTIMLHQPLSQLDSSPVQAVNSCAPARHVPSGADFNVHTQHTVHAAKEISKMVTQAVPMLKHTHFFTCVVTLSSIVHLSKWAMYWIEDEDDLRELIRLNIGALKELSEVWKAANTACGQVRGVAQEIYRHKKAQQISPTFWVGFTQEQMMSSINADESIMAEMAEIDKIISVTQT